jgi:hypothetical protein
VSHSTTIEPIDQISGRPVDPALRDGIGALYCWLLIDRSYSQLARESICRHVAREGTLEGAEFLAADDMAEAEAVFVDALEPVPFDDPAWGEGLDERGPADWPATLAEAGIAPIAGGSPEPSEADWRAACELFREPEPFTPSAADLAEMHAHRDAVECLFGYE